MGQAVGYTLNNWEALNRYLEQGYLAIDNNLSERTLRAMAVGRNNWGVIGSEAGGRTAAVLYTVVGTCKHLGLDPFAYLREALPGLFALGEKPRRPSWWSGCRTSGCYGGCEKHRVRKWEQGKETGSNWGKA